MNRKRTSQTWIFALLAVGLLVYGVRMCGSLPIVHFAYPSGECRSVWSPDPAHSCTNLPKRYEDVWVAQ